MSKSIEEKEGDERDPWRKLPPLKEQMKELGLKTSASLLHAFDSWGARRVRKGIRWGDQQLIDSTKIAKVLARGGNTWKHIAAVAKLDSTRMGHSMVWMRKNKFMVGVCSGDGRKEFSLTNAGKKWLNSRLKVTKQSKG